MAREPYLIDSNVLIRWVQTADPGFQAADAALDRLILSDADLCYTSQNLGEFWNAMTRPANRNGYGSLQWKRIDVPSPSNLAFVCSPTVWRSTTNGEDSWWNMASLACWFTMRGWLPPCASTP
jgi:hypothetical protein